MTEREILEGLREVIKPVHDFWERFLTCGSRLSFVHYEVPKEYLEKFHRLYEALDKHLKQTGKPAEADTPGTANRLEPPVETPQLPPPEPPPSPALPEPLSVLD